jgi:hypothetical protein
MTAFAVLVDPLVVVEAPLKHRRWRPAPWAGVSAVDDDAQQLHDIEAKEGV